MRKCSRPPARRDVGCVAEPTLISICSSRMRVSPLCTSLLIFDMLQAESTFVTLPIPTRLILILTTVFILPILSIQDLDQSTATHPGFIKCMACILSPWANVRYTQEVNTTTLLLFVTGSFQSRISERGRKGRRQGLEGGKVVPSRSGPG